MEPNNLNEWWGGINKVFGEKYFKHQKPEKNEKEV